MQTRGALARQCQSLALDVICAGEPLWKRARPGSKGSPHEWQPAGVLSIAQALARQGIRVGLAAVLDDDTFGRASLKALDALGVETGGVKLALPASPLVFVDAGGAKPPTLTADEPERAPVVPSEWSSQVLLLSGLSPLTSAAASLCRAARKARREGATIVLDLAANLRLWWGRDARTISAVLREADILRGSFEDLAVLGLDASGVRRAMRPGALLVKTEPTRVVATGPFGEVQCSLPPGDVMPVDAGSSCSAAICAELARPQSFEESPAARWHRALRQWALRPSGFFNEGA